MVAGSHSIAAALQLPPWLGRGEFAGTTIRSDSMHPRSAVCPLPENLARSGRGARTALATMSLQPPMPLGERSKQGEDHPDTPIGVIGGGVSGIYAALELAELGYRNITILERELRVGGKAAAFEYAGLKYPLGAVSTPFALKEASFTGAQVFERPVRFVPTPLAESGEAQTATQTAAQIASQIATQL